MKRKLFLLLAAICVLTSAQAEDQLPAWLKMIKISGYAMGQYQYTSQEGAKANTFAIRLGRVIIDAHPSKDWAARVQFQYNGNTADLTQGIRVVDVFAEWQDFDFLKIKAGQFKRAFTFENPMNPIDQGFMSYSQNVSKLAGFADRDGAVASNGRDIGVQLQGDFLKNANDRYLLHYQIGVYNGQGINTKDVDQQKDIIGGVWVMPVKGLRIGAFGWEGSYSRKGSWTDEQGKTHKGLRKLPQHRYAFSAEYKANDWTLRSEYIHSTGKAFTTTYKSSADLSNANVNEAIGSKADGLYALAIAPLATINKQKLYIKARYDVYRESADWGTAKTYYEAGFNYLISKNLQINLEYARVNDKSRFNRALSDKHDYNMVDCELDFRF